MSVFYTDSYYRDKAQRLQRDLTHVQAVNEKLLKMVGILAEVASGNGTECQVGQLIQLVETMVDVEKMPQTADFAFPENLPKSA